MQRAKVIREKSMKTKIFSLALSAMVFAHTHSASAQQPKKVPRVGTLWTATTDPVRISAFRQGLRELGYVEGKNIVVGVSR
jgi:putative ABC transport system substrate-binding protein